MFLVSWDRKRLSWCIRSEFLKRMNIVIPHHSDLGSKEGLGTRMVKVCQVVHRSVVHLDKHSTLDLVIISVVSSIPTGDNFLLNFLNLLK